jgi:exonuclease III
MLSNFVTDKAKDVGAVEPGWESAWSLWRPNQGGAGARKRAAGTWNGVATFARSGLLLSADADPLGDPELDCEGRCLATDHGAFVLFNVYIPTSGEGYANIPFKMRFLRALRAAMAAKRAAGRAVILAGDLNIARRPQDVPWRERLVDVARALGEAGAQPYDLPAPLAAKLRGWRAGVREALSAVRAEAVPARGGPGGGGNASGSGGAEQQAFRAVWRAPDGRRVLLGRAGDSREGAARRWALEGLSFPDPHDAAAPPLVAVPPGVLSVGQLVELVTKVLEQPFPEAEQRALAACASSSSPPCLRAWADALEAEDGMVDSFAALRPNYAERFTCWDQYTNARYIENQGARIDYAFVDGPLFRARAAAGPPLSTGGAACAPESAEAARAAATAGGGWQPAPFDGSGMQDAPMRVYDTQFEPPATVRSLLSSLLTLWLHACLPCYVLTLTSPPVWRA